MEEVTQEFQEIKEIKHKPSPFKKIDSFIFEKIDQFKTGPVYLKLLELINNIPYEYRQHLNQSIILLLFIIPGIFLSVVFYTNYSLKQKLDIKKQILQKSTQILSTQSDLQETKRALFSYPVIKDQGDLDAKIRSSATKATIDLKNITTQDYLLENPTDQIFVSQLTVQFSKLSYPQLIDFLNQLMRFEKVKVSSITINKNPDLGLLDGNFQLTYYSEEVSQ